MTKILVIDDEPLMRALVCRWAHAAGYVVAEAASLAEAVALVGACAPAVVLCDLGLPDGDGRELSDLLRQRCPQTALILMSGLGSGASTSCLGSGAIGFLAKPFNRAELLAAIQLGADWHFDRVATALWARTSARARASHTRPASGSRLATAADPIQSDPAVEAASIELENSRRRGLVAADAVEHRDDVVALDHRQGPIRLISDSAGAQRRPRQPRAAAAARRRRRHAR